MYSFSAADFAPHRVHPSKTMGKFQSVNPEGFTTETVMVQDRSGAFVEKHVVSKVAGILEYAEIVTYGTKQFYEVLIADQHSGDRVVIACFADSKDAEALKKALATIDKEQPIEVKYFLNASGKNRLGVFQGAKLIIT